MALRVLVAFLLVAAGAVAPFAAHAQGFVKNSIQTGVDGPRNLVVADVNQDGFQDVVVVAISGDNVAWYEHDGSVVPGFTERDLTATAPLDGPRDVHVADLDADGDQDILVVTLTPDDAGPGENGQLVWFENDGTTTFSASVLDNTLQRPRSVSTADMDGDGALDIVVASAEDSDVFYYRSDGGADPGFVRRSVTGDVPGVSAAQAGDMDGDGDIDVVASIIEGNTVGGVTYPGNRIIWLENEGDTNGNGKPNFVEYTIQSDATGAIDVDIADVNGDGALDIVSAIPGDNTIAWHENDGTAEPSFTNGVVSSSATDVRSVSVGDAEGDGDIDIFGSAFGDDAIYAFANSGQASPTFTLETVSSAVDGAIRAAVARVDADDKLDVFAIAGQGNEVLWFKNESTVLPVELVSFDAVVNETVATLSWATLSETNNDGFSVEQREGGQFVEIGYVPGQGTTVESQTYRFKTDELSPGTHVFRLRQVDYDGSTSYSPEVEVQVTLGNTYTLTTAYPNPFQRQARMDLRVRETQHVRVDVFDYLGRRVKTLHDDTVPASQVQPITFSGEGLPSGAYFVRAVGEDFQVTRTLTLVK